MTYPACMPSNRSPAGQSESSIIGSAQLVWELGQTFLADQDGYIVVLRVFLDESGTHKGANVISVAAYVATPREWKKFTREWQRVLKPTGVRAYHASDSQNLHGEFEGWEESERDSLAKNLIPIIPRYAHGFATAIVLRDLRAALGGDVVPKVLEDQYKTCFQLVLHDVLRSIQKNGLRDQVAVVHERNDFKEAAGKSYDFLKKYFDDNDNLAGLTFSDKYKFVPLQAADVLAYEAGKRVLNRKGKARKAYQALKSKDRVFRVRYFDEDNIHRYIEYGRFIDDFNRTAPLKAALSRVRYF